MKLHQIIHAILLIGVVILPGTLRGFEDSRSAVISPELTAISKRILVYKLVNQVLPRPEYSLRTRNFAISSPDDPDFSTIQHPEQFTCWVRPIRYTPRKELAVKGTWFFLRLNRDLKPGMTYQVKLTDSKFITLSPSTGRALKDQQSDAPELSFVWHGNNHRSESIHVNQVGYQPDNRKYAYLTQYAGVQAGRQRRNTDIDFGKYQEFHLIDADSGAVRFRGSIKSSSAGSDKPRKARNDRLCQSRVWEMDFSHFSTPGRYRIQILGIGVSYPFVISKKVYNQVFGVLCRGIYQQRCGVALNPDFTRHPHPACHLDDARIPAPEEYERKDLKLFPQQAGKQLDCKGGHHNAGDYSKYTINSSLFIYYILQPFEVIPEKLRFQNSPIPESEDRIPDLIQVVKRELDWLIKMQDGQDGAVFTAVRPDPVKSFEDRIPGQPSAKFSHPRCLWWKDTHATAALAAALARAARTEDLKTHYPKVAGQYLRQAEKAWGFCLKNTDQNGVPKHFVGGQFYGETLGAVDEYCWMAIELWLSTGKAEYHDYFLQHFPPKTSCQWSWRHLLGAAGAAARTYFYSKHEGRNPVMLKKCREQVIKAANETLAWQSKWAFRPSFPETLYNGKYGWIFLADLASYDLLLASTLDLPDQRYRQAAAFNADQELGNNPNNLLTITGLGCFRPVDHVHRHSRYDDIIEPVPGIPLGFHPSDYQRTEPERYVSSYLKGGMPIAYRYFDGWNIAQEFNLPILAKTVMTYAMMADPKLQQPGKPKLAITANGQADKLTGELPFDVEFIALARAENGKDFRDIYWDLNNEEFACDAKFSYRFKVPGIYRICCTATDDDGWAAYRYLTIKVTQAKTPQP